MATQAQQSIRCHACERCGAAAYLDLMDGREWRCLLCARPVPEQASARLVMPQVVAQAA